jgi:hypothetical protein
MSIESYKLEEDIKKSRYDIETGFLGRWSILSGGTFSLLIPLLQSLGKDTIFQKTFIYGEFLIIASLISSLVGLFAVKEHHRNYSYIFYIIYLFSFKKISIKRDKLEPLFLHIRECASLIAMISYIAGVILIALFINANLL